jgi:hypothetical protein
MYLNSPVTQCWICGATTKFSPRKCSVVRTNCTMAHFTSIESIVHAKIVLKLNHCYITNRDR